MLATLTRATLFVTLLATSLSAEVVRMEVQSRSDLLGGQSLGAAGGYEKIAGTVFFAVDPALLANRSVVDLDKAPRNASGKVEFSADFYIIKPKEISRGNGAVLCEVSNRGRKGLLGLFNHAEASLDPTTMAHVGDGFLMQQGFTLLWVGWQFDPPRTPGLLHVYPPIASERGRPIEGLVRSDFVVFERTFDYTLADRDHLAYPAVARHSASATLTVRDAPDGPRRTIPRSQWKFARLEGTSVVEDATRVYLATGFEPGRIYEVVYTAQDPPVAGVGAIAIRDVISRLKYGAAPELDLPTGAVKRALGFGVSQSGRFLRTFLYDGLNRDEGNRKVFDGVIAHVAGAGRGSFNHRFAQPSRDGQPFANFLYPTDIFPFTDVAQTDPVTGATDGLLTHAGAPELLPKVFYTNASYEYWGRAASLIHTTLDGLKDAPLMDNVRIYLLAGGQHGPGPFPPVQTVGQQRNNPLDYRWAMKALLVSMDRWLTNGTAPPPSRYPTIAEGTVVPPNRRRFPALPGVFTPTAAKGAPRLDYGPRFSREGVITREPPKVGRPFPILVPQVDADGNDVAGIRMPELAVPLATYTGWNLFNAKSGPIAALSSFQGSYIPLRRTAAERTQTGDPRLSIAERYRDKNQYLELVTTSANALVGERFLLAEDVPAIVANAGRHWDYLVTPQTTSSAVGK